MIHAGLSLPAGGVTATGGNDCFYPIDGVGDRGVEMAHRVSVALARMPSVLAPPHPCRPLCRITLMRTRASGSHEHLAVILGPDPEQLHLHGSRGSHPCRTPHGPTMEPVA